MGYPMQLVVGRGGNYATLPGRLSGSQKFANAKFPEGQRLGPEGAVATQQTTDCNPIISPQDTAQQATNTVTSTNNNNSNNSAPPGTVYYAMNV